MRRRPMRHRRRSPRCIPTPRAPGAVHRAHRDRCPPPARGGRPGQACRPVKASLPVASPAPGRRRRPRRAPPGCAATGARPAARRCGRRSTGPVPGPAPAHRRRAGIPRRSAAARLRRCRGRYPTPPRAYDRRGDARPAVRHPVRYSARHWPGSSAGCGAATADRYAPRHAWAPSRTTGRARVPARGIPTPAAPVLPSTAGRAARGPVRRPPAATCPAGRSAGRWWNPARRAPAGRCRAGAVPTTAATARR